MAPTSVEGELGSRIGAMSQAAVRVARVPASDEEPAVRLRDVTVRFTNERATTTALDRISVEVPRGGFLTLLGPSGCGKSTLLRVVADLIAATSGDIRVLGGSAAT